MVETEFWTSFLSLHLSPHLSPQSIFRRKTTYQKASPVLHRTPCASMPHSPALRHTLSSAHMKPLQPTTALTRRNKSARKTTIGMGTKKPQKASKTALRQNPPKTESQIKVNLQSQPKTPPTFKPELKPIQPPQTFRSKSPSPNSFFPSLFYN